MEMEEVGDDPASSSSSSSSSSSCGCGINRKRKFQDGILLLGVQKHKNAKTFTNTPQQQQQQQQHICFPSNNNIIQLADIKLLQDLQNMRKHMMLNNNGILIHSPKDRNSFSKEDAPDYIISVSVSVSVSDDDDSNNEQQQQQQLKTNPYDGRHSTSSVNWSGTSSTSTSTTHFYPCPSFEDDLSTTTTTIGSSGYEETKQSEVSMEDLFCSNRNNVVPGGGEGLISNHFVLSSGRWDINQDTKQRTEKLTIDKEFEQYFSMLML